MGKKKYAVAGIGDLRSLLEEQNYKCAMTGEKLEPDNTAFDHIIPLSKGGTSLKDNLQAVIRQVNISKSDLSMEEFMELCYKILAHKGKEFGYSAKKISKTK